MVGVPLHGLGGGVVVVGGGDLPAEDPINTYVLTVYYNTRKSPNTPSSTTSRIGKQVKENQYLRPVSTMYRGPNRREFLGLRKEDLRRSDASPLIGVATGCLT